MKKQKVSIIAQVLTFILLCNTSNKLKALNNNTHLCSYTALANIEKKETSSQKSSNPTFFDLGLRILKELLSKTSKGASAAGKYVSKNVKNLARAEEQAIKKDVLKRMKDVARIAERHKRNIREIRGQVFEHRVRLNIAAIRKLEEAVKKSKNLGNRNGYKKAADVFWENAKQIKHL